MWKFIYELGSPKAFYDKSNRWLPWIGFFSVLSLTLGLIWGLFFAPADYQQGDAFRIIYIHVPCAFLSLSLYTLLGFLSVLVLIWRIKMAGLALRRVAELGALMSALALITGSIWGKPMWGAYWVWDARLTSELILFFLYAAVLAISSTPINQEAKERMMAILSIVGLLDLPIIHYSVYWWNTLHQGSTLSVFAKPKIAAPMLYPLLLTLLGFGLYCAWSILSRLQIDLLSRDKDKAWTDEIIQGEQHA